MICKQRKKDLPESNVPQVFFISCALLALGWVLGPFFAYYMP